MPEYDNQHKAFRKWEIAEQQRVDLLTESFKATIQFQSAALRGTFLINAGAIIALLTYLGNTKPDQSAVSFHYVGGVFLVYITGLIAAVFASFMTFISQLGFTKGDREEAIKTRSRALWMMGLSAGLFVIASAASAIVLLVPQLLP